MYNGLINHDLTNDWCEGWDLHKISCFGTPNDALIMMLDFGMSDRTTKIVISNA
jgi:hypothetical protein